MGLLTLWAVTSAPTICRAETTPPRSELEHDSETDEDAYSLSFPILPYLKLTSGVSIYPELDGAARYDLDVIVGGRVELTHGQPRLELVPELGYSYHNGHNVEGHYGLIGLGLRYGNVWFAGSTVTTLLLGSRESEFDLGVRAGLRFEALLGFLGLEVSYEHRALAGDDLDALRVIFLIDAAIVVMPMTLTRMGWAFGRRR